MMSYQQSQKDGFYSMISQKISKTIDQLPSIPCLSQRWIWQLIQNAKDSDSDFNKIKIKIEIHDNKFIFSHNGNPFILKNLNSLIFHYSAKDEENKQDVETTGKYGTGFMVTYTVSKKVQLQCKLKGVPQIRADYENDEDEDWLNDFPSNQVENETNKKQKQKSKLNILITNKEKIKGVKVEQKAKVEEPYYQDLKIMLDRTYVNVKELKEKIMKISKSVQKQLSTKPKDMNYTRTENSFDTCFIYGELDETSFSHIEKGMNSLKLLFPLVLLFNKKIFSIEVKNYSTKINNLPSFKIISQSDTKLTLFHYVFTTVIYEMKNKEDPPTDINKDYQDKFETQGLTRTQQYLYSQRKDINAIIAFPVQIVNQKLHLLRFPDNFPKIFKEFPLIGCEDLGFNFAFNSKQLYPSENRRQLLLKQQPGRSRLKPEQNHKVLIKIFTEAYDSYTLLAKLVNRGKFNLFVVPKEQNFLYEYPLIKEKMVAIVKKVYAFQVFENMKKQKKSIKNVDIFYDGALNTLEKCRQSYEIFNFLFPEALANQDYDQLMKVISKNTYQLYSQLQSIQAKFINIQACTSKLQSLGYQKFTKIFQTQTQTVAFNCLQKIYTFLIENMPLLFYSNKKIILNQQLRFCCFYQDQNTKLHLEVNFQNKVQYFQIAKKLKISIQQLLIHNKFTDIISPSLKKAINYINDESNQKKCPQQYNETTLRLISQMRFEKCSMLMKIQKHFQSLMVKEKILKISTQNLITLGQYLYSFSDVYFQQLIFSPLFERFKATNYPLSTIQIQNKDKMVNKINSLLSGMFRKGFLKEILKIYKKSTSIDDFTQSLCEKNKIKSIEIINYLHKIQKILVNSLPNADEEIKYASDIEQRWLKQGFDYLTEDDITIFERLYKKCSQQLDKNIRPIHKMLVHPSIINSVPNIFTTVQFSQLFKPIKNIYNQINIKPQDKEAILNYTYNIYEQYIIKDNKSYLIKYNLFKEIINLRHLEFGKLLDKLNDEDKDLICKIFKMKDKFKDLRELINNYNIEEILAIMRKMSRQK